MLALTLPIPEPIESVPLPERHMPNQYSLERLEVGQSVLVPNYLLEKYRRPIMNVSNCCHGFAKRNGLPMGTFSCRTLPAGILIIRVK